MQISDFSKHLFWDVDPNKLDYDMPEMFTPIDWHKVKAKIKTEVKKYIKSLK